MVLFCCWEFCKATPLPIALIHNEKSKGSGSLFVVSGKLENRFGRTNLFKFPTQLVDFFLYFPYSGACLSPTGESHERENGSEPHEEIP